MTVPVTTGGKKRTALQNTGAARKPRSPATMTAPKIIGRASDLSLAEAMIAVMGATPAKVTPLTKGNRAPIFQTPRVWRNVASPAVNRQAPVRKVRSVPDRPAAAPTIRGGATTPAYMAATCWRPLVAIFRAGSFSSTGWTGTGAASADWADTAGSSGRLNTSAVDVGVREVVRDGRAGPGGPRGSWTGNRKGPGGSRRGPGGEPFRGAHARARPGAGRHGPRSGPRLPAGSRPSRPESGGQR